MDLAIIGALAEREQRLLHALGAEIEIRKGQRAVRPVLVIERHVLSVDLDLDGLAVHVVGVEYRFLADDLAARPLVPFLLPVGPVRFVVAHGHVATQ